MSTSTRAAAVEGAARRALDLGFSDSRAWTLSADQPWWVLVDLRDMLNVFHPFVVPTTGTAAGATRLVTLPDSWRPPFALRFYHADDYFADPVNHKPGQLGTESFFEHRFKQVLIDDTVVWERDVADENALGSKTSELLDITPHVAPGKPFELTFRVFDKVSTTVRNNRDVWFIGGTWYAAGDGKTEQEPRFHTAVWFADPVVGEKDAVESTPEGRRPHEAVVAARHQQRWPLPPPGEVMPLPVALELVTPAAIPPIGFPVTCGIPMPPGVLRDVRAVGLQDRVGREVPVQASRTGLWPDGSVRWLLLKTIAPGGAAAGERLRLHLDRAQAVSPAAPVTVQRDGTRIWLDTGALRLDLGGNPATLVDAVCLRDKAQPVLTELVAGMSVLVDGATTPVIATCRQITVIEDGPVAATVEVHGTLDATGKALGRFTFRLTAWAGLAVLQASFRIINDVKPASYNGTLEDPPLDIAGLALRANVPGADRSPVALGIVDAGPLRSGPGGLALTQDGPDHFTVTGKALPPSEGKRAQGWIAVSGDGGCCQVSLWRFWQQFPKSLALDPAGLRIGLFAPTQATPLYRPRFGEAKRHDLWFTFSADPLSAETQTALGRLADMPPRLFNGEWFCRSGGVNVLDPHWFTDQPQLKAYVAETYGDVSTAKVTGEFGIRSFGDKPYNLNTHQWLNGYWAMVQGALNWGLAGGNTLWFERSFEIARHIADVDSVHLAPDHPDWNEWHGLTCALGVDHSVHNGGAKWPAFQLGESLLLHYWLTGDPDSREAGLANADYILRSQAGLGSSEARSQARAMLTLLRAWEVTGDTRFRDGARRYLDLKYQTEHVVDWRRGAYIQPTYQNWRCVSAGLDSMYAHDIYEYYRLTGDLDAARMVVAMADSVYAESMLPQEEGLGSFLFYVRYSRSSWYYTQMAMLFCMAYDLTEDLRFLRAGRAAFARYLLCTDGSGKPWYQPFHNFGWLDPECGGWLTRFKDVPTAPFTVTSQTPVPDPARY